MAAQATEDGLDQEHTGLPVGGTTGGNWNQAVAERIANWGQVLGGGRRD